MSSKGTIFLTSKNEHVYDETLDWSIVFEIEIESIERVEIRRFDKETFKSYTELLRLEDHEYIVIQTRNEYNFSDSYKIHKRDPVNYIGWIPNQPNCIIFHHWEIEDISTDSGGIIKPSEIKIYVKKNSEWYREYIKVLKGHLEGRKEKAEAKINIIKGGSHE